MSTSNNNILSDTQVLDLLSEANEQYEQYLEITKPLDLIQPLVIEDTAPESPRSWSHPLTLVIKRTGTE